MKKLNLLKPDKRTVYLSCGKGQEVNYLDISEDLKLSSLEKDVKAGATHFAECLELAKKKPSRYVIVDCTNKEEGLMAVNYLAAVYNEADGITAHVEKEAEDTIWNVSAEQQVMDISDFECMGNQDDEYEDVEDNEDNWIESPYRVPIIKLQELINYENWGYGFNDFAQNNQFINGIAVNPRKEPYWMGIHEEPVCILAGNTEELTFNGSDRIFGLCNELRRFRNNRHVYVVIIHEEYSENDEKSYDEEDIFFIDEEASNRQCICEAVLEYTAALFEVKSEAASKKKYYNVLFENWAPALGVQLEKGFPKAEIAEQIIGMNNKSKSELIEKVYKYVLAQENIGDILTKEDFAIMKKFKLLGVSDKKKDSVEYQKKMNTTLVGLEAVKEQVNEIVDVMKFNRKRAKMGLGNGSYHNVHLMLGAPGTAKTTVAQLMGNIMREQKLLPGNRFISINGADLKGLYVGHSAPKTKAYFDNYDIILIDEAYSIASDKDLDSFSQEAIAQLIIELEKHGMDKLVIFAGYGGTDVNEKDNKMIEFLNANPGIRSRINSTIYFESYIPEQMVDIVHCQAKTNKYILTHDADNLIREHFAKRYKLSDFGNGREARSLLENITVKAARRVMRFKEDKMTKKSMQELKYEDVEAAIQQIEMAHEQQNGKKRQSLGFNI